MDVRRVVTSALAAVLVVLGLVGCSPAEGESPSSDVVARSAATSRTGTDEPATGRAEEAPAAVLEDPSVVVTAQVPDVAVHDAPDGQVTHELEHPNHNGVPLTLMVVGEAEGWWEVQLPVRPNGTTGWVRADDVRVAEVPYRLEVSVADAELVVYRRGIEMHRFPVATGTGDTPTPTGTYYLTELLEPLNEGYGPYAYGVSAFSEVLEDFLGGPGQIGLHGTDDESSIGQAVSHGCIRLANEDITLLAGLLPLGTPITIT